MSFSRILKGLGVIALGVIIGFVAGLLAPRRARNPLELPPGGDSSS